MQLKHRWISIVLAAVLSLLLCAPALAVTPEDYDRNLPQVLQEGHLYAESAVLIDGDTGTILFSKNSRYRMYPASTTKIMTLLLAIESGIPFDTPVIIPQQASQIPSDSTLVPVFPGDQMTFGDLLYGFMLSSGNDGANAIAVLVGGSIDAFVERMNQRARELGCTGTHFANAHGYQDAAHFTTAEDMAKITQAAMKNGTFRQIVACPSYTMTIKRDGEVITPKRDNTNSMLNPSSTYYYADCVGVKTGTHSLAGNCFVGAAERDGVQLISVVFKCPQSNQKSTDTSHLMNYGFTRYTAYPLDQMFEMASDRIATVKISNAIDTDPEGGNLELSIAQISDPEYVRMVYSDSDTALDDAIEDFVTRSIVTIDHDMVAPVSEGEVMGRFRYVDQSGREITATLRAGRAIEAQPRRFGLTDFFPFLKYLENPLVVALIIVIVCLIILILLASALHRAGRQRRRSKIYEAKKLEQLRKKRERERSRMDAMRRRRTTRTATASQRRRTRFDEWEDDDDYDDEYDDYDGEDEYDDYDDYDDDEW